MSAMTAIKELEGEEEVFNENEQSNFVEAKNIVINK